MHFKSAKQLFTWLPVSLYFQAQGQASQRVYLATRLFSETVASAIGTVLGNEKAARAIRIVDRWFDVMNSRCARDDKPERCGYGVTTDILQVQESALKDMVELISGAHKPGSRKANGGEEPTLLPFQRGILRSTSSLRDMYRDLRAAYPDFCYLATAKVN